MFENQQLLKGRTKNTSVGNWMYKYILRCNPVHPCPDGFFCIWKPNSQILIFPPHIFSSSTTYFQWISFSFGAINFWLMLKGLQKAWHVRIPEAAPGVPGHWWWVHHLKDLPSSSIWQQMWVNIAVCFRWWFACIQEQQEISSYPQLV